MQSTVSVTYTTESPRAARLCVKNEKLGTDPNYRHEIKWFNLGFVVVLHVAAAYGLFLCGYCKFQTILYALLLNIIGSLSVTVGAHRFYSHKSFKTIWPVRLAFLIVFTNHLQSTMYTWVVDHRVHHKYTDTDADPYNASRGLIFSHVGWIVTKKHPLVYAKGKCVDVSDLIEDPMIRFQKKYILPLYFSLNIISSILIPMGLWGESYWNSLYICYALRYAVSLHVMWNINSLAHYVGSKPYNRGISASDHWFVSFLALGEGTHNFHHSFPWDYRNAALGWTQMSLSTLFIDALAWFGLAFDRKFARKDIVEKTAAKTGDGTYLQ